MNYSVLYWVSKWGEYRFHPLILSIYSWIYLFIYLFTYLYIYLFTHLFIYLFTHLFIYRFIHLFISLYLLTYLHIYLFTLLTHPCIFLGPTEGEENVGLSQEATDAAGALMSVSLIFIFAYFISFKCSLSHSSISCSTLFYFFYSTLS